MILIQLVLYCLLLVVIVKVAVRDNAVNGLYFYPKEVQEKAYEIGLTDRETVRKQRTACMIALYVFLAAAPVLFIGAWNGVSDFKTAYLQALLFLEVMNWFDGIVIDMLWVGHSSFWVLPGLEDVPYVQTWGQMVKKRVIVSLVWVAGAAIIAGLVVLFF